MKYVIFILALTLLQLFTYGRSVSISETDITLESPEAGLDLTASGKWFVQVNRGDWDKSIAGKNYVFYPDNDEPANVLAAQSSALTNIDIYVAEAVEGEFISVASGGDGFVLSAVIEFDYAAACFEAGSICHIYTRQNNVTYQLQLFPDINDETEPAMNARVAIEAQFEIIETQVDSDRKFK